MKTADRVPIGELHTFFPIGVKTVYDNGMRNLQLTEAEESALVQMVMYFTDLGWIDSDTVDAFESVTDKICEPSPFDYS